MPRNGALRASHPIFCECDADQRGHMHSPAPTGSAIPEHGASADAEMGKASTATQWERLFPLALACGPGSRVRGGQSLEEV